MLRTSEASPEQVIKNLNDEDTTGRRPDKKQFPASSQDVLRSGGRKDEPNVEVKQGTGFSSEKGPVSPSRAKD